MFLNVHVYEDTARSVLEQAPIFISSGRQSDEHQQVGDMKTVLGKRIVSLWMGDRSESGKAKFLLELHQIQRG